MFFDANIKIFLINMYFKIHKNDKTLDYDPTSIHFFNNGCFFIATGSNKNLNLHTKDG